MQIYESVSAPSENWVTTTLNPVKQTKIENYMIQKDAENSTKFVHG